MRVPGWIANPLVESADPRPNLRTVYGVGYQFGTL